MREYRILLAFDKDDFAEKIKNTLSEEGYNVIASCTSGNDLIRKVNTLYPDIVVTGFKFNDLNLLDIYENLEGTVEFLALIQPTYKEIIDEELDIFTIQLPLSKSLLINTLQIIFQSIKRTEKLQNEIKKLKLTLEERKIIDKAKGIIMKDHNFSEEKAFRFIQKESMNKGIKMISFARLIIGDN